jgi:DNA adenine methylase
MLTYDDAPKIRQLAEKYGMLYRTIPMKTTLHYQKLEIIISDNFNWWNDKS